MHRPLVLAALVAACAPDPSDTTLNFTDPTVPPGTSTGEATAPTTGPVSAGTTANATGEQTGGDPTTTTADPSTTADPASTTDPSTDDTGGSTDITAGSTGDPGVCGDLVVNGDEECDHGMANNNNGDCTTLCKFAVCGDGLVHLGEGSLEDCDDGNADEADGCRSDCVALFRTVFVTSKLRLPTAINPLNADKLCGAHGLEKFPGKLFRAWLSTPQIDAFERIGASDIPYRRSDGAEVAQGSAGLLGGQLLAPIDHDEFGMPVQGGDDCEDPAHLVWTGTLANGTADTETCKGWGSESDLDLGQVGRLNATDDAWTAACHLDCSSMTRMYCVEYSP